MLDGIARIPDIVTRCQELGLDAYALTDHGVMYGALEFYKAMRSAGLNPLIGCEVYVAPRRMTNKDPQEDRHARHLVLIAMNREGYTNLMHLCSLAATVGFYYKPRIDFAALTQFNSGLLMLTGCPGGVVAAPYRFESPERGQEELERYLRLFGEERVFVEIQNHGLDMEQAYIPWAQEQAKRLGLPVVATNDCHYVYEGDARAHDIALCLRDRKLLTDTDRLKYSGPDYYIKSEAEMRELFAAIPEALANTRLVADKCDLELDLTAVHFPRFTISLEEARGLRGWLSEHSVEAGESGEQAVCALDAVLPPAPAASEAEVETPGIEEEQILVGYLRQQTYEGAAKRYGKVTPELTERIEYELSVIIPKGFTTYFLICADFCRFAWDNGIPVGPGRGSAAGSVVAYSLEITDLDPMKYNLYFERFLNPERIELPDFDIDFCYRRRDEVIDHVKRKYGPDKVALIITYMRLKAKAVIKAVGRTKGLPIQFTERVTKEIQGLDPSIEEAIAASPGLKQLIAGDPEVAELVEDSRRLEGIAAHHSVHAAGLVIAPDELWHFVPTQPHKDSDLQVTQYAMDTVPYTGLVKFDFLGLRNLTMIQDAVDFIHEVEGVEVNPRTIPDDDTDTYAMLQRGDNYGVFQFEAPQVKRMLIEGHPENLIDLAAINAANRPGPIQSGNTELYLQNRKRGGEGHSQFPLIEEILKPTGGVLLFQEQVLEIARKLAGFTFGEADVLRKAMGKKKQELMDEQRKRFLEQTAERGHDSRQVRDIWDMMEKFAGYGFNKSHSTCYAWVAFQTAYLKCHYPQYFMAAMLNSWLGNSAKLAQILAQCRLMRITVLPPSVNSSGYDFRPTKDGAIYYGLGGVKGIGAGPVDAIVSERQTGGEFQSLEGFYRRMKGKGMNKKVLQSLAMSGAFDCLHPDRAELIQNLDDIEGFLRGPDNQMAMFGDDGASDSGVLPSKEVTQLDVAFLEKEAIGLFLTHHPFADHVMYRDTRYLQLAGFEESVLNNYTAWIDRPLPSSGVAGLLSGVQVRHANTSSRLYAKARLEDPERSISVVIWPKAYENARDIINENTPVILHGRVQIPETVQEPEQAWDELELVVDRVLPYSEEGARIADPGSPHSGRTLPEHSLGRLGAKREGNEGGESADSFDDYLTEAQPQAESTTFNPAPLMSSILFDIDLREADLTQLSLLAQRLEKVEGEREVRLRLRDVSQQLVQIKLNRRFYINDDVVDQLEQEFPFLRSAG